MYETNVLCILVVYICDPNKQKEMKKHLPV